MTDGPTRSASGVVVHPRVLLAGGAVALIGVVLLGMFIWMVPSAAAREATAACRGLLGDQPLNPALCPNNQPCALPVEAPDFTAIDHQGNPVKLSSFRGKVVLLNFWASWCNVCKTEKPSIQTVANELGGDELVVVTLASDRSWSDVLLALIASLAKGANVPDNATSDEMAPTKLALDAYNQALPKGVAFRVFLDPPNGDDNIGAIAAAWGIKAVPETALIDRKGNIRAYFVNKRDWKSPVAQTCIRSVMDE
ncbi:MAG: TlpA family protein disulfide reductase [Kofleriaceae bacterium]